MSFLTDSDLNKRARNLFMADVSNVVAAGNFRLNSELADMVFTAVYLADVPTAVPLTSPWSAGLSGVAVTLSNGNRDAAIPTEGTVIGQMLQDTGLALPMYEVEILAGTQGLTAVGARMQGGNPDLFVNGESFPGNISSWYQSNGLVIGGAQVLVAPYVVGDIIGMVFEAPGSIRYYRNGAFLTSATTANTLLRAMASTS